MFVSMHDVNKILEAHKAITRIKGKEYAPTAAEIQEWLDTNKKSTMEQYSRTAIFDELKNYCYLSKEHDYIEICEWYNGEGFDVEISGKPGAKFQLTWGQLDALNALIKELNKNNQEI
jgi:hypothetical protein